uniref:Alternative protein SLC9A9 n=1 Tax=Homo sapiens TaxID=9606 RepID=L8EBG2_HUMAN|nr:alternative protein SLC9A9 [Homo sapiens]
MLLLPSLKGVAYGWVCPALNAAPLSSLVGPFQENQVSSPHTTLCLKNKPSRPCLHVSHFLAVQQVPPSPRYAGG